MDDLFTLNVKIESQSSKNGYIKDQWPYQKQNQDHKLWSGTSRVLQNYKSGLKGHGFSMHLQNQDRELKFGSWVHQRQRWYPNQDRDYKAPSQDWNYMDDLFTLKVKIESKSSKNGYIKDQWPYQKQNQDHKLQSETSRVLQNYKSGLKGHGCSLHLQNQDREP